MRCILRKLEATVHFFLAMQVSQKLKTAFRVPPGKFVQTLKAGVSDSSRRVKYVRCFTGHRDGVWHVSTSKGTQGILASASAGKNFVDLCLVTFL